MAFSDSPEPIIEALEELVYEAVTNKKRVFNRVRLTIKEEGSTKAKAVYLTLVAEPQVFDGSMYIGEDILYQTGEYFTTSVIEQSKQIEKYNAIRDIQ